MQREISNRVFLGQITSPLDDVQHSTAIDRTASDYTNPGEKVEKIRELVRTGNYDADMMRYIPVYIRVCLRTLILKKNLQAHPTKTWNN